MEIFKKISAQKKYIESLGYKVLYIGLNGSQNYSLDDESSDIDLRAIVLPTIEQVIRREKISIKYSTEIGDVDVKDVMTYYEVVRKGNFSFIEPMQTKWFIGDKYLRGLFGTIKLNYMSLYGDVFSKIKVFRHPFPSKNKEISKWGYDPKQLHHVYRLIDLLELKDESVSYIDYANNTERKEFLYNIKRNKDNIIEKLEVDISTKESMEKWAKEKLNKLIPKEYKYEQVEKQFEVVEYIKNKIKENLFKSPVTSARHHRTFNQNAPKNDLEKFEKLRELKGKDVSYIVYEILEIL